MRGFPGWLAVVLLCFDLRMAAAEVQVLEPLQQAVVFAGRGAMIEVPVANRRAIAVMQPLEVRVFQLTSSIAAPVGERRPWKTVSLLASQTALERLEVNLPEVRALSLFRIAFYSGDKEIGRCHVVAIPPSLLKDLAKDASIAVANPQGAVASELEKLGVTLHGIEEAAAGGVVLFGPFADRAALLDAREKIKPLTSRGAAVIIFLSGREFARAEAAGLQSLTGVVQMGSGKLLQAKSVDLSELATSAKAQLALHQLLTLAREEDTFPWLPYQE